MCFARLLELVCVSPHIGHVWSALTEWVDSWAASLLLVGKFFPQIVQIKRSSTVLAVEVISGSSFSAFSVEAQGSQVMIGRIAPILSGS